MNKKGDTMLLKTAIGIVIAVIIVVIFYYISSALASVFFDDSDKNKNDAIGLFEQLSNSVLYLTDGGHLDDELYNGYSGYHVVGFSKNQDVSNINYELTIGREGSSLGQSVIPTIKTYKRPEQLAKDKDGLCLCKGDVNKEDICIKGFVQCREFGFAIRTPDNKDVLLEGKLQTLYISRAGDIVYITNVKDAKIVVGTYISADEMKNKIRSVAGSVIDEKYSTLVNKEEAIQKILAIAKQESEFVQFKKDGSVLTSSSGDYGVMQINKIHSEYFDGSKCGGETAESSADCNIRAGTEILLDGYKKCINDYSNGKLWDCKGGITYKGWDCAFRMYNGWSSGDKCDTGDPNYVANIHTQLVALDFETVGTQKFI